MYKFETNIFLQSSRQEVGKSGHVTLHTRYMKVILLRVGNILFYFKTSVRCKTTKLSQLPQVKKKKVWQQLFSVGFKYKTVQNEIHLEQNLSVKMFYPELLKWQSCSFTQFKFCCSVLILK